jgi:hypothetical protein
MEKQKSKPVLHNIYKTFSHPPERGRSIGTFLGPEMATSETLVHDLPTYLFFYMVLGHNDFDGENPLQGPLEGMGPENYYVLRHINNRCINSHFAIYFSLCYQPVMIGVRCTSGGEGTWAQNYQNVSDMPTKNKIWTAGKKINYKECVQSQFSRDNFSLR